jgi:hypothetical protein
VKGVDTEKSVRETQVRHRESDKGFSLSVQVQRRKEETVCSRRDRPNKVLLQQGVVAAEEDQVVAEDRAQEGFSPTVQGRVAGPYKSYGAPEQPGFVVVL